MTPMPEPHKRMRPVRADDYAEPLAGMIRRGEIEPPDEMVIEDAYCPCGAPNGNECQGCEQP